MPQRGPGHGTGPDPAPGADRAVHLSLLLVQLLFSAFHVVAKSVLSQVRPLALAGVRVMVATPVLITVAAWGDRRLPSPKAMVRLALLGFFGVFLNQLLFITGLNYTTATNAAILMPSIPAFAAAVSAALRIEKITPAGIRGVCLSMLGALIMLRPLSFTLDQQSAWGNLCVLANCLCYAIFLVLQRPLHQWLPWRTIIAGAFFWGGCGVMIVSWPDLVALPQAHLPATTWWGVGFVALIPTTLGYLLNTWALRRSTALLSAAYTTLQPLFSAGLAALFLGERLGAPELAGFVLISAGLWQVSRR